MSAVDHNYMRLVSKILDQGDKSDNRTGVHTLALFGESMTAPLANNTLPALNVRRVAPRIAFEELMFMLNGKTDTTELEAKNVNIWKGNTSREFLDDRGLEHLEEGDMGRMYGAQLRDFSGDFSREIISFDQLIYMVIEIENNPESRRIIATHYNPAEADQGALFPCHIMTQFNVRNDKLDCLFWMRSSDVGFGLPYNLMYYAMFTHMMAKLTGYEAGKLVYQAGDSHIYQDQIDSGMMEYMNDNLGGVFYLTTPKFIINKELDCIQDMLDLTWDDVEIQGYDPMSDYNNKPKMAV